MNEKTTNKEIVKLYLSKFENHITTKSSSGLSRDFISQDF